MTIQDSAPEAIRTMLQPLSEEGLQFDCHPGVSCFTECCRDLNLLLTPYDVVRLKNRLALTAADFLDRYTESRFDDARNLTMVYLRMRDDEEGTCPFVSAAGCLVYPDRPSACRIYPLARAARMNRVEGKVREDYFVLREDHCKGFAEGRFWRSAEEWNDDQELGPYHEFNNLWMEIVMHARIANGSLSEKQRQMFFLASYNLDQFRKMILGSRFLQIFELPESEADAVHTSDEALLRLAFKWLGFSLCNEPVLKMRPSS